MTFGFQDGDILRYCRSAPIRNGKVLLGGKIGIEQADLLVSKRIGLTDRRAFVRKALDEPARIEGYGFQAIRAAIVIVGEVERKPRP